MYGNLRPNKLEEGRVEPETAAEPPTEYALVSWQLLLLMAAEFLLFAAVVVPLLPNDNWGTSVSDFWLHYSWIAAVTCFPYIFLTLPVAVGYTWFIQKWPWNTIVWACIVVSLASVVHIASVATDPRGVFVGCVSIACLMILFSGLALFDRISFAKSPIAFLIGFVWQTAVFLPVFFFGALGTFSSVGAGCASLICSVMLISEFRLIENRTSVLVTEVNESPDDLFDDSIKSANATITATLIDPFTQAIWINCASWRFLFQSLILLQKIILQFFLAIVLGIVWLSKRLFSCFARRVDPKWLTPTIVGKLINVATTATTTYG